MNKFLRLPPIPVGQPHFVRDAKRHLEHAYTILSILFVVALGEIVFATMAHAAPVIAQYGIGWFFNDGNAGNLYVSAGSDSPAQTIPTPDQIGFERQLLAQINRARSERALPPLRLNETLTRAARAHAREMARTRRLDVKDEKGFSPRERAEAAGYAQPLVELELISTGAPKPDLVLNTLLSNSNTQSNLLNPDVNEIGLGYANVRGDPLGNFWTIELGRRSALSFTVVVNTGAEATTNRNVVLNIGGKGWARQMQISNAPDFAGAPWETFAETKAWTVTEGTGPKKIFVKLRGTGFQDVDAVAEIAFLSVSKGQNPGAHSGVAQPAPRAPNLRQLIRQGDAGNVTSNPTSLAFAPAADTLKPGFYQTSEFMLGKVAVGIVMPQCTGAIDRCTETWSASALDQVTAQVQAALTWWSARAGGRVTFVYDARRAAPTGYEPINHPQSDESLWIGDTLAQMGFPGANYFEQVYAYNNWLRQQNRADWAMTIFVANSLASPSGTFSNGYFAYAYVPGPFLVVTYDNDGYGIAKMAAVVAHETGHIFGALDQYTGANVACAQTSGYLLIPTQNSEQPGCASNLESIMRGGSAPFNDSALDPYALGQIGGRASSSNGIPDPINTTPRVTLNAAPAQISTLPILISGIAEDLPVSPPSGDTININTIAQVQYRINAGAWQNAAPVESAQFNQAAQKFSFSPALVNGQNIIDIVATNSVGNTGTTSVTLNFSGATAAPTTQPSAPTATRVPPTATLIPPTATAAPAATRVIPTNTALPPTATNIPPTATRVAPTATPVAPTPAPPQPTAIPTAQLPADRNTLVLAINVGNTAIALPSRNYRASSLLDAINAQGGSAYEVNKWTGRTWQAYNIAGGAEDFEIEAGSGYMVKAKNASTLRARIDPAQNPKLIPVRKGWDFIGVPTCPNGAASCYTASSLIAAINADGGGVAEVDRWVNGAWNAFLAGYSQNDFPVIVGQGYYIRSTKAAVWKPE